MKKLNLQKMQNNKITKYVLLGAAGYIAPKHFKAIKETGGELIAILDPHDSVGIIDTYFPDCKLFTEFERFDRFCSQQNDNGNKIDYVSICSPNYLHEAHCRFAMRIGANAICEKPLALREKNLEDLKRIERQTGKKVFTILQLRLNPILIHLKNKVQSSKLCPSKVSLVYHTPRGDWYDYSWKANAEKSGKIITNIGIHLLDLLCWIFGPYVGFEIEYHSKHTISGLIMFKTTTVDFHLSISRKYKPLRLISISPYRYEYELSDKFTELHTESYKQILAGNGYGIEDAREAIALCEAIRGKIS